MKADIRDISTLMTLQPLEVASYLRAVGWQQVQLKEGKYSIWTQKDDFEIILPLLRSFRDYALRMGDLLRTLSEAERRSQLDILSDLFMTNADVVRVRIADDELADGSIPIEEHTQTAQKVRDMMLAAACSTIERRAVWHKRKPDRAIDYLRGVRIGQTERGSYILTIISRVPPMLSVEQNVLFDDSQEEPYERMVIHTLADSLQAIEQAAESAALDGSGDKFTQAVPKGVSANLCEAVAGLSADDENHRSLEFGFSWSRSRPSVKQISRVVLPADRAPFVKSGARVLRGSAPIEEAEIEGAVIKLEREENASTGQITVYGLIDDVAKRIRLELSDTEYHKAVKAHDKGLEIYCSGQLVREGHSYRLKNPTGFTVRENT